MYGGVKWTRLTLAIVCVFDIDHTQTESQWALLDTERLHMHHCSALYPPEYAWELNSLSKVFFIIALNGHWLGWLDLVCVWILCCCRTELIFVCVCVLKAKCLFIILVINLHQRSYSRNQIIVHIQAFLKIQDFIKIASVTFYWYIKSDCANIQCNIFEL